MKLTTDIAPRKDGTLAAKVPGTENVPGTTHVFKLIDGKLVAEIEHDAHVAYLLDTGNFYPADESDIKAAVEVTKAPGLATEAGEQKTGWPEAPAIAAPKAKKPAAPKAGSAK